MIGNNKGILNTKLLSYIVLKHGSELLPFAKMVGYTPLTEEQREVLRGLVSDELSDAGLDENSEPNAYGLVLEQLIDQLGYM